MSEIGWRIMSFMAFQVRRAALGLLFASACAGAACSKGVEEAPAGSSGEKTASQTGGGAEKGTAETGSPAVIRTASGPYRTVEVTNGGALRVRAVYTGDPLPKQSEIPVDINVEYCGHKVVTENLIVDPQTRGLKNVVVRLEGINAGKPPIREITVVNRNCMFEPHVGVAMKGTKIKVKNADPVLHTTHPYLDGQSFMNVSLPSPDTDYPARPIPRPGLMELRCDVHKWMRGYIVVHTNPYIGVTNEKGELLIDRIPPGTYPYVAWHEELGEKRGEVKIGPGETVELKLEFAPKE